MEPVLGCALQLLTRDSRLVNIAVGVLMVLGGISQFFPPSMSSIVVGIYVIVFGLGRSTTISHKCSECIHAD
jgi:uncharacterized membrane protein HdeD (DUF308 family)